ncbi:glycosyltransferase [Algoriphagus limi]|uniref:Glycosyltransferase n=1 Tax=Algoriphagus limi TaxID=2975273 RepID=A0ABT2G323_9BACT|nr:glycosyltransferase [Algoriphagus limi]MCS5489188.1 glycosyltransferase [Algoriphagus limi]
MNKLLIFYDFFTPAYKGGGIIRSLDNLSRCLVGEFEIFIFTSNNDLGSLELLNVPSNQWVQYTSNVHVWYSQANTRGFAQIKKLLITVRPDVVYINGMFTPSFVLFPLLLRNHLPFSARWVVAPRGMLQRGALSVKPFKKKIYLKFFKILKLHRNIQWHATDQQEGLDIRINFPHANVCLAYDTPKIDTPVYKPIKKESGYLHLVFISLITAKKNIKELFETLSKVLPFCQIELDVYGPIKDSDYWEECQPFIQKLPAHVKTTYHGEINPSQVTSCLQNAHFFVLPSLGENFGHAIYESFHACRPVIISDRTPWKNLQQYPAGWDFSLEEPDRLLEIIMDAAKMGQEKYDQYCIGAQEVANKYLKDNDFLSQYKKLFGF